MKTLVLYRSVSGFTKRYAEWIAEELGAELCDARGFRQEALAGYDAVAFGGSLHAVGIKGIDLIKRGLPRLEGKRVAVFATGASPTREDIPAEVLAANFSEEQRRAIRFFYLRGGFDFDKLDLTSKALMTLLKWRLLRKRPEDRDPDERGMLAAYRQPMDFTRREGIRPIVDYLRGLGA